MKSMNKSTLAIMVLTLFCAQTYAAGFAKYDGINGETISAKEQNHQQRTALSTNLPLGMEPQRVIERRVDRAPTRIEMKWDTVRNRSWNAGSTGGANDRPTEEVSFYFNKIPAAQPLPRPASRPLPAPNKQITDPGTPEPISLLIPAVQKVR